MKRCMYCGHENDDAAATCSVCGNKLGVSIPTVDTVVEEVSLDEAALLEQCTAIGAGEPDLVVLCGDIVDEFTQREELETVFRALGKIPSTYGTFYVYGNHDRNALGRAGALAPAELEAALDQNGIVLLQDRVLELTEDLTLVGCEDRSVSERAELPGLLAGVDPVDFILVLDHQPDRYAEHAALGTDLLLSGHTHGGQLFPLNLLMELIPFNDGNYGLYPLGDEGCAVVTSGFAGWCYPIKTAAPAEYVMVEILPA